MGHGGVILSQELFDHTYYERYQKRNILGRLSGERLYLYNYWKRFLKRYLKKAGRVLDIGCGIGFLSRHLATYFTVTGADTSAAAIERARLIAPNASFSQVTGQTLPFDDNSFGAVFAFDVLEHRQDPRSLLCEIKRVLSSGGVFVVSVPNTRSVGQKLRGDAWYAYQDPTHVSLLSREEWTELVQTCGYKILRVGTDFLWDVPYVKVVPVFLQRYFLVSIHWFLVWVFGFLSWNIGETLFIVAIKESVAYAKEA